MSTVLKPNLSLCWIGGDDETSDEYKDAISNKCWTPVELLRGIGHLRLYALL